MGHIQKTAGSSSDTAQRQVPPNLKPLLGYLERILLGQSVQPPNTAISVPLQQAVSSLQSGSLINRLTNPGQTGGAAAGPNQWGLQSRAQLGLPDRQSYMGPFTMTADQIAQLGAVPGVQASLTGKQALKGAGKQLTKKERIAKAHPEVQ